ncbi:MAG: Rv2231c family pyridoxal phosphate-dependent protein CobC, partial [Nocardioidaceae bacterium]
SAPDLEAEPWDPAAALGPAARPVTDDAPVVAVAGGRAFTFRYAETEELLAAAGCRVVVFDPTTDTALPAGTAAVYLGGGFPEMHASRLGDNTAMRSAVRGAVARGVPTVAECAGLLYLCETVDGVPMAGAIAAAGAMTPGLTLGYRRAQGRDSLLTREGEQVAGHEFHRTTVQPGHDGIPAWQVGDQPAGFASATLHASYLHTHWAGFPQLAARLAAAARARSEADRGRRTTVGGELDRVVPEPVGRVCPEPDHGLDKPEAVDQPDRHVDLLHHGDREVGDGLVDLAVNVHPAPRPDWLSRALVDSLRDLDRYPDPEPARQSLAVRHRRERDEVLPTAGGAEAFTLVARMRRWRHPVVVHPQFTEPEAALRAAGHEVGRVLLDAGSGFTLDPARVPEGADLVVVGNPTNPTGVLHPRSALLALARPGRVVVVDEAFMDAVPGEPEGLACERVPGLVVLRSLTKTWAVPGLRAGYAVGDRDVIAALERQQPPWSVATPALAAALVCCTPQAAAEAGRRAWQVGRWREPLVTGLRDLGLDVVGSPVTPFVLLRGPAGLRERLREAGLAVRRGDTFPGLGPTWVRIAVRDEPTTRLLLDAVGRVLVSC